MNRKNAIILSVVMNSVLLTMLLVIGLTSKQEKESAPFISQSPSHPEIMKLPLFQEEPLLPLDPAKAMQEESPASVSFAKTLEGVGSSSPSHLLPTIKSGEQILLPAQNEDRLLEHEIAKVSTTPPSSQTTIQIVVQKGDNLDALAKAHHTTVTRIKEDNNLASSLLRIGQVLKITPNTSMQAHASTTPALAKVEDKKVVESQPSVKQQKTPDAQVKNSSNASVKYYTVKYGDNPWTIAMKHQIKVKELLELNGLNEEKAKKLKPGDKLRIR